MVTTKKPTKHKKKAVMEKRRGKKDINTENKIAALSTVVLKFPSNTEISRMDLKNYTTIRYPQDPNLKIQRHNRLKMKR